MLGVTSGPRRILITGSAGSGKTWLGRELSARLGYPHIELDGLYHGPNWTPADPTDFRAAVAALVAGPEWVIDGNYRSKLDATVRQRAELVIALDLPRLVVLAQLLRRTVSRMARRTELWNGNTENWRNLISRDPQVNLLLWAHQNFGRFRRRARADELASRAGGASAVRLTSRAQLARFAQYLSNRAG